MSCGCGCNSLGNCGAAIRYQNPSSKFQPTQMAHGAPKLPGRLGGASTPVRYLNRPNRFAASGNNTWEGAHLGGAAPPVRYLNRPNRFAATSNTTWEGAHLGFIGYDAVQPVTYLFYQTVQGGPYSYLSVPATAWGAPYISLPSQPPGGVASSPGNYMVQWYGGVQGDGAIYGSDGSEGFWLPPDPVYTQVESMAAASGIPVRAGILRQTSLPAAASGAVTAISTPANVLVTSAPLTQSGASSSNVAPIVTTPVATAVESVTPETSTTVAPATVTIVSDAPTQIPVDNSGTDVNASPVTSGLQFTTLDYFLIAALAAVLILE
jgi:hypothetical protein